MPNIKISELDPTTVAGGDQIPVARGSQTLRVPTNNFVLEAANLGGGQEVFKEKSSTNLQFRTFTGTGGVNVTTVDNTINIDSSELDPARTVYTSDGITTIYAFDGTPSVNLNNYRVTLDGLIQEPDTDFTVYGSTLTFSSPPPKDSRIVIVVNNLRTTTDITPSDDSVSNSKIQALAVTENKIGSGAITNSKANPSIIHGQTAATSINDLSELLVWDYSTSALKKLSLSTLINTVSSSITASLSASTEKTSPAVAKAWVRFDGTKNTSGVTDATNTDRYINSSYNINSVTRTGTGQYTINLAPNTVKNANYVVTANPSQASNSNNGQVVLFSINGTGANIFQTPTVNSFKVQVNNNSGVNGADYYSVCLTVFGE